MLCSHRTNVECLEGRFDTYGTFGFDFTGNLTLGGASAHTSPELRAAPAPDQCIYSCIRGCMGMQQSTAARNMSAQAGLASSEVVCSVLPDTMSCRGPCR
jgi:hypothetical protein